jgi:hypothetical protein
MMHTALLFATAITEHKFSFSIVFKSNCKRKKQLVLVHVFNNPK